MWTMVGLGSGEVTLMIVIVIEKRLPAKEDWGGLITAARTGIRVNKNIYQSCCDIVDSSITYSD